MDYDDKLYTIMGYLMGNSMNARSNGYHQLSLIPVQWRGWVRTFVLLFTLFWIILFFAGIRARFEELTTICSGPDCPLLSLSGEELKALTSLGLSTVTYAHFHIVTEILLVLISVIPMAFVFWRMSHTWIGILTVLALLSTATNIANMLLALFNHYPQYGLVMAAISRAMLSFIPLFFFLFPTGRYVLPWTKVVAVGSLVWMVALGDKTLHLFTSDPVVLQTAYFLSIGVALAATLIAIYSQFYRYRYVSGAQERQQIKMIIVGFVGLWLSVLVWTTTIELFPQPPGMPRLLGQTIGVIPVSLLQYTLPIAVSMAILRYRLWEIDIFIRRTMIYGSLTSLLLLFYLGSVVLLQLGFRAMSGQNSGLAIVITTLAIAALFNPLRARIQNFIDRRFFRRRYDAHLALEAFASTSRSEGDLEALSEQLLSVVSDTIQPENVSLWILEKE
jgi:hypothetical protein